MEIFIPKWALIIFIAFYAADTIMGWVKWYYRRKIEKLKTKIKDRLTK